MNKQLVFLAIKEANKPVHNNTRQWKDRSEILSYYMGFYQKVKKEFEADEKVGFNSFCNLARIDLKFNFRTYVAFEQNINHQLD